MTPSSDGKIALLRHTVATLAYRGGKALRGAPVKVTLVGGAGGVGASVAFDLLLRGALR